VLSACDLGCRVLGSWTGRYCPVVLRIGLTGGIGSGKSTVSRLLAARGAVIVDADVIAREVVEPGSPGLAAVAAAFGDGVLTADGSLDRPALAAVVFTDPDARKRLDAIVHPLVRTRATELAATAPADAVVVHDVPLLAETAQAAAYDLVVVVEVDSETRVARLVERGLTAEDARARIAAQATDEKRRAIADVVLDNSGTPEQLAEQVDRLWAEKIASAAGG
jgi:dephospho-CoA kinase